MPRFPLSATQRLGWVEEDEYAQHDLDLFIRSPVHFPCPTCSKPSLYLSFVRILDCHRTLVGTSSSPGVEIGPTVPVSLAGTCFDEFADA
jgi:hypothetical protein